MIFRLVLIGIGKAEAIIRKNETTSAQEAFATLIIVLRCEIAPMPQSE